MGYQAQIQCELRRRLIDFASGPFDLIMGAVIVANTAVMFAQLQIDGYRTGQSLGIEDTDIDWIDPGSDYIWEFFEHFFNFVFTTELVFRVCVLRLYYFKDASNVFDASIVLMTDLNVYVLAYCDVGETANVSFMRLVRIVRVVRVLRVIRTLKLFRQLRILVLTVVSSCMALLWSMILLAVFMLISSIFLCQTLNSSLTDPNISEGTRHWMYKKYGTTSRALYTMFEVTFSGGWPNYADKLIHEVNVWYAGFFILYVSVVVFAIIRIITALFLKETLNVAANDADLQIQERLRETAVLVEKLGRLFLALDASGDGYVTLDEFEAFLTI